MTRFRSQQQFLLIDRCMSGTTTDVQQTETESYILKGTDSGNRKVPEDIVEEYLQGAQDVTYGRALLSRAPEKVSWFWGGTENGILPDGKVTGVASYSGEGKTTMLIHLLARAGGSFLGQGVAPFKRALFLTETDESQIQQVLKEAKPENPDSIGFCFSNPTAHQLVDTMCAEQPDVLVVDSLTSKGPALMTHRGHRFEWHDPACTTSLLNFLRQIKHNFQLKALVVLLHTVKAVRDQEGNRIRSAPALEDIRGSGSIAEQLDVAYVLRPSGENRVGWLYRVKRRSPGVIEKVKFSYEEANGRYIWHPLDLTKDSVIEAIRNGNTSRGAIAAFLHFRKESIVEMVAKMIEDGSLTETGAGRNTELHIV